MKTIEVQGAPHDCLFLSYAGGDRLFLPVENIELLSRYGSDEQGAQLDRLGGGAWQAKKAKLKERILKIAEGLIRTAETLSGRSFDQVEFLRQMHRINRAGELVAEIRELIARARPLPARRPISYRCGDE